MCYDFISFFPLHPRSGKNFMDVVFSQAVYLSTFLHEGFISKSLFEYPTMSYPYIYEQNSEPVKLIAFTVNSHSIKKLRWFLFLQTQELNIFCDH